jgi:hypothetical protein
MPSSLLPVVAAGGAAGMFFSALPRAVKIVAVPAIVLVGVIELTKDANESWFSAAIFGGQGEQGAAQMVDPKIVLADSAAGREVSGAKRTVAAQWQGLNADAIQKQVVADAASEPIEEIARKKVSGQKLTSTESLRLEEYKKMASEAEIAAAQATAARAEAEANRAAAELNARLIASLQRNDGDIFRTFFDIFVPKGVGLGK